MDEIKQLQEAIEQNRARIDETRLMVEELQGRLGLMPVALGMEEENRRTTISNRETD